MNNAKMKSKMKKMMLVAGMATVMNLTIGIQNEGWTMMKDEEKSLILNGRKLEQTFDFSPMNLRSLILNDILDGDFNKEKLILLRSKNISTIEKFHPNELEQKIEKILSREWFNCGSIKENNIKKALLIIKNEIKNISIGELQLYMKLLNDLQWHIEN
jgi:hypothetical protein